MKITFEGETIGDILKQIVAFSSTTIEGMKKSFEGEMLKSLKSDMETPEPKEEPKKKAPKKAPKIGKELEEAVEEIKEEPAEKQITLDDLIAKARKMLETSEDQTAAKQKIRKVLTKFNAKSIREVAPENYTEVFEALN
jgi:hypothetical protein